jgi:hypothetical protein
VIVSSACSLFALHLAQEHRAHVVLEAVIVFVVTTLIWLPWLWPYVKDALGRVGRRFAR